MPPLSWSSQTDVLRVGISLSLCFVPQAVSKIGPALMAGNTVVLKPPTQGAAAGVMMVQVGEWGVCFE